MTTIHWMLWNTNYDRRSSVPLSQIHVCNNSIRLRRNVTYEDLYIYEQSELYKQKYEQSADNCLAIGLEFHDGKKLSPSEKVAQFIHRFTSAEVIFETNNSRIET